MKKILFYLALISLFPATAFADSNKGGNHPVSDYVKQHVMPVITEKRKVFDASLTATEQNELASLRVELAQLHQNHKAAMQQKAEESAGNAPAVNHDGWKANRAQMKEIMQQVRVIADNHKDQLDQVFSALAPQQQQWKSDIAQLKSANGNEHARMSEFVHSGMYGKSKAWGRSGFLLLDASKRTASAGSAQSNSMNDLSASSTESMSIYPNPAVSQFSLNLSGVPSENKLTVTDMTGKTVFEQADVTPSQIISCNDLNNGVYFLRLTTSDQTINQKIIVSH